MQVMFRGSRELEGLSCGLETSHQPWFPILGSSSPSLCQLMFAVSLGAKPKTKIKGKLRYAKKQYEKDDQNLSLVVKEDLA